MTNVTLPLLLLVACAPDEVADAGCAAGLDMDGDGACDREVADWSADATVPEGTDRANIYQLSEDDLLAAREAGLAHIFAWPVATTRLLLPYQPLRFAFEDPDSGALRAALEASAGFSSEEGMYDRMGLARFPGALAEPGSPYWAPPPAGMGPGDPMGASVMETDRGEGLTFSCATCHVGELFGRPVVGLTTRRARPNTLFHFAATGLAQLTPEGFQELTRATDGEVEMFEELVDALSVVGTTEPAVLGLDTSLAQVARSLSRRAPDAAASLDPAYALDPEDNLLDELVADSKPMVWWTMRYKTRWLSDGAIISGNPNPHQLPVERARPRRGPRRAERMARQPRGRPRRR